MRENALGSPANCDELQCNIPHGRPPERLKNGAEPSHHNEIFIFLSIF